MSVLFGSGLVGGEGLLGVGVAGYAVLMTRAPDGAFEPWVPILPFGFLVWLLWRAARGRTMTHVRHDFHKISTDSI